MASWFCGWNWLLDLTADVLRHDPKLDKFDGGVSDSGEGRWTLHSAVDLGVPTPVISAALLRDSTQDTLENTEIKS